MDIQRPLFWYQGLFLQPQHFQLQERSFQSMLAPFHHFLSPHFWGIGKYEIQEASLGNRTINLLNGEFLFPDGTYVVLPDNALVSARSFDEAWIEGGKPFTVYIGLKKLYQDRENVTVLPQLENISEVSSRFVTLADPEEVKDFHQGGSSAQVKRLYYVLRLFWEKEKDQLGDYILLPLAQMERIGEEIKFSESFIPPSLSISGSDPLLKLIKEIRDQIAARGRQLEEFKRQKGIHTSEFGARDMVYLLALRSINRYVPLLFHITEARQVHPWIVYGIVRQLIGELSSFSEKIRVMGEEENGESLLPGYDHRNLGGCFSAALTLVTHLIDEITAGPEYVIRLLFDGTYYGADLPPTVFEGGNRFYLVFKTEEDPKSVLQSVETISKANSREFLPILIARSLPGIKLEHLTAPPQELPRRANCLYFRIDHHSDQWASVEKNRNIALYWDTAPDDLEIELMVVGRS